VIIRFSQMTSNGHGFRKSTSWYGTKISVIKTDLTSFSKGHEGCGEIIEIGEQVQDERFRIVSSVRFGSGWSFTLRAAMWAKNLRFFTRETRLPCLPSQAVDKRLVLSVQGILHSSARMATTLVLDRTASTRPMQRLMYGELYSYPRESHLL